MTTPLTQIKSTVSSTVKLFVVGFLVLICFIPTLFVWGVIEDRSSYRSAAVDSIAESWGAMQQVVGPLLTVPALRTQRDANGRSIYSQEILTILPTTLRVNGDVQAEQRSRGIYHVPVYQGTVTMDATFVPTLDDGSLQPYWEQAVLVVGLDARSIQEVSTAQWNGTAVKMQPGAGESGLESGISARLRGTIVPSATYTFRMAMRLRGTSIFAFSPVGTTTKVTMSGNWPGVGFSGPVLPDTREVRRDGFSATWNVSEFSRSMPQWWLGNAMSEYNLRQSPIGVHLVETVDAYAQTLRAVKYAILFIALTFVAFFLVEMLRKLRIHPFQYILVGAALALFYLLLLSLSEYIGFTFAYLISSVATVVLITLYCRSVLKGGASSAWIAGLLVVLYGYLFFLLRLEDYALLLGSIMLFVILAVIMALTRKIDWYRGE